MSRKIDGEGRALVDDAIYFDKAMMLSDDAVHHGQAQSGSFADILGRKKRLEQAAAYLLAHPYSGIGHSKHDVLAGLERRWIPDVPLLDAYLAGGKRELPALGHSIAGVKAEIHQHLLEPGRVRVDRFEVWLRLEVYFDCGAEGGFQKGKQVGYHVVDVHFRGDECLPTGKGQELARQACALLGAVVNGLQICRFWLALFEGGKPTAGITHDGRQQIIEIVGNSAYQQAEAFHLLRSEHVLFQMPALDPQANVLQALFDSQGQASQVRFQHIIVESQAHGLGSDLLAAGITYHDDGHIRSKRTNTSKYIDAVGPLEIVIGEDNVYLTKASQGTLECLPVYGLDSIHVLEHQAHLMQDEF